MEGLESHTVLLSLAQGVKWLIFALPALDGAS